jgi:DNA-binding MarR family transcriptional regulator
MTLPLASAYLRLIQVIHHLESQGPFQRLDAQSVRLLEIITVAHMEDRSMTVSAAMKLSSIASPASIHRKLEQLRMAGLITHEFNEGNRRTKYLAPTPLALKHFDTVSSEMIKIKSGDLNEN